MRTNYKLFGALVLSALLGGTGAYAQSGCAITATNNLYGWGCGYGDEITDYELNGILNSSGCSSNGFYTYYTSPTWSLQIGQTYTWSASTGGSWLYQGFAIWIDLNNDGFFTSNEQLGNSPPAATHSGSFMVPFAATAGAGHRMRIRCDYYGNISNTNQTACETYGPPNYNFYYGEAEDYDVYLLPAPPCSGTPGANSVVGPTMSICPNTSAELGLATTYTVGDLVYLWQAATQTSLGPWTNVGSGQMSMLSSPLTQNTWFQAIVTCSNSNQSITAAVAYVQVQGITVDSVPYLEDFEGITENDELPNCSWAADNLGFEAFTYTVSGWDNRIPRSGNNFASFYYYPGNTNSFYTNAIYLNAGVTYSASVWYTTNLYGDDNWEDLSILLGPNQDANGQVVIASTPGPAISSVYKSLSNTFSVQTTGNYYVAVRTTVNTNSYAYYLSWDDLEIIAPCSLNPVNLIVSTGNATVCAGTPVTINATGGHKYLWSTGATSDNITINPTNSELFSVTGTNTMTGCKANMSQYITVNPLPFVAVIADKQKVCPGGQVNLTAVGNANTYNWSVQGASGTYVTVSPQGTTVYSVQGTNNFGCSTTAAVNITVHPAANVNASASPTFVCIGDAVTLTGSGASSYQWMTASTFIQSNPAVVFPTSSTAYTLMGTDANGCTDVEVVNLEVNICEGLSESNRIAGIRVYPNPGTGLFTLQMPSAITAQVEVVDIVGRVVYSSSNSQTVRTVNISELANGMYYFKVKAGDKTEVIRVLKN